MKKLENVEVIFKPYVYFNEIKIRDRIYFETVKSPNLFIIKCDDVLMNGETVKFDINKIEYTLEDIYVCNDDDSKVVECRYWREMVIS